MPPPARLRVNPIVQIAALSGTVPVLPAIW